MIQKKNGWLFSALCLLLGVLAEASLFEEEIGISYSIWIAAFYLVFFYQFRTASFTHKQIGLLLFVAIGSLSLNYAIYSNPIFNMLNYIVIPCLVLAHTVLVISPSQMDWHSKSFLFLLFQKIGHSFAYGKRLLTVMGRRLKKNINEPAYNKGKKMAIGSLISVPLLFIVTFLLSAADEKFAHLLVSIPEKMWNVNTDFLWQVTKIAVLTSLFYCYLKSASKKTKMGTQLVKEREGNWDAIIITTILVFMNLIYLLFTVVQFQYFFSGTLEQGISYSEYARRGFFELLVVTIINYAVLLGSISFVKNISPMMKALLTLLIVFSGVLLTSAFLRLLMYEQAYGFTYARVLAHSFMLFLWMVFAVTLVKVWERRLSLTRLYIILALLYYVGLNMVGMDQLIVSSNTARYEDSGKIDAGYLGTLSYSAVPELVELYEKNPDIPGLKSLLMEKKRLLLQQEYAWQSFNISREKAIEALTRMEE